MTRNQTIILGMALVLTIATEAIALEVVKPNLVDTFNKWTMWSYNGSYGGKGEVCYIYSKPPDGRDFHPMSVVHLVSGHDSIPIPIAIEIGQPDALPAG